MSRHQISLPPVAPAAKARLSRLSSAPTPDNTVSESSNLSSGYLPNVLVTSHHSSSSLYGGESSAKIHPRKKKARIKDHEEELSVTLSGTSVTSVSSVGTEISSNKTSNLSSILVTKSDQRSQSASGSLFETGFSSGILTKKARSASRKSSNPLRFFRHDSSIGEERDEIPLDAQMTKDKLRKLHTLFMSSDGPEGPGVLSMVQFRAAVREVLGEDAGRELTDKELDMIFMKVDINCDNGVDWNEYLTYQMHEEQQRQAMFYDTDQRLLPATMLHIIKPAETTHGRHTDDVICIVHQPSTVRVGNRYKILPELPGRYITSTRDGLLRFFSVNFALLHSMRIESRIPSAVHEVWVTNMVYMANVGMLAVACTPGYISFYSAAVIRHLQCVVIVDKLEISISAMDYWFDSNDLTHGVLYFGDERGNISVIVFRGCRQLCYFRRVPNPLNLHSDTRVSTFSELLHGQTCGVKAYKICGLHQRTVNSVIYCGDLDTFFSSSSDQETSVFIGDLFRKKSSYVISLSKGVSCMDYSQANSMLVTGSRDGLIRGWNPHAVERPLMILHGNEAPIVYLRANDFKDQLVSVAEDKAIMVFDLSTQTRIQTLLRGSPTLGSRLPSAAYYNIERHALIIATNYIGVFEQDPHDPLLSGMTSHFQPVNTVLYNRLFDVVVSAGDDSVVAVWNANTGERVIQFTCATYLTADGTTAPVPVTTMRFDGSLRRLVVGLNDGCVSLFNFNNGSLIRQVAPPDAHEVSALLCASRNILTAGWARAVRVYPDIPGGDNNDPVEEWHKIHDEDILCLALQRPTTVVSASFDGDIILWSLDNGHALARFNADFGVGPLKSRRPKETASQQWRHSSRPTHFELPVLEPKRSTTLSVFGSTPGSHESMLARKKSSRVSAIRLLESGPATAQRAVEQLLFMESRPVRRGVGNLVSAGGLGWVRFWECHAEGELVAQFNAGHIAGAGVTAMCCDRQKYEFLITGDSDGYVKVWFIRNYATAAESGKGIRSLIDRLGFPPHPDRFQLLSEIMIHKNLSNQSRFPPPPEASDPARTWSAPLLITSFRAHVTTVMSLDYIDFKDCFVSASSDCSVRMWNICGAFVGIFGQETPWLESTISPGAARSRSAGGWGKLQKLGTAGSVQGDESNTKLTTLSRPGSATSLKSDERSSSRSRERRFRSRSADPSKPSPKGMARNARALRRIPADVRLIASAGTLRVLYGGTVAAPLEATITMTSTVKAFRMAGKSKDSADGSSKASSAAQERARVEAEKLKANAAGIARMMSDLRLDNIGTTDLSLDKSNIIGVSYRRQRHYRPVPVVPHVLQHRLQSDVYKHLPCHELTPCASGDVQPPAWMIEGQMRRRRRDGVATKISSKNILPALPKRHAAPSGSNVMMLQKARHEKDCTFIAVSPNEFKPVAAASAAAAVGY